MNNERQSGIVVWFNNAKGYGFVRGDKAEGDVFVHYSQIQNEGYKKLKEGQRVSFSIGSGPNGRVQAENVEQVQR